jgi:hypothetical protein
MGMIPGFLLIHKVHVQIETVTRGAALGRVKSYGDGTTKGNYVSRDVACRVTGVKANDSTAILKDGTLADVKVFFNTQPNLDEKNRLEFTDPEGVVHHFHVKAVMNPNYLGSDGFWKALCIEERKVDNVAAS